MKKEEVLKSVHKERVACAEFYFKPEVKAAVEKIARLSEELRCAKIELLTLKYEEPVEVTLD